MLHTRTELDNDINQIVERLQAIVEMVSEAVKQSIVAMKDRDVKMAEEIVNADKKINKARYKVEKLCLTTIATQQPAATDLRKVIAAMHIAIELERIGDHAAGIANSVIKMAEYPLLKPLIDLPRMAEINCEMMNDSIKAFFAGDTEAAKDIIARDAEVDQLYSQIFRELLVFMLQDPKSITRAQYLLWASHAMERIGDRVTNIAERTIFVETGKLKDAEPEDFEHVFPHLDHTFVG